MEVRTATSTLYDNQTANILSQSAHLQQYANELSSGVSLNLPSDDPIAVSQVIQLTQDINNQDALSKNAQLASNQLTTVDGALSNLTDVLQSARTLAVQGANGLLSASDRKSLADQINQLFNESVAIANTQYNGSYVFSGTAATPAGPITTTGDPASGVTVFGNNQVVTEKFGNGQTLPLSTSLQAAFNVGASDNTPSVFQTLLNLRDALNSTNVTISSTGPINATGTAITAATTLGTATFAKSLTTDTAGNYAVTITGSGGGQTFTFTPATDIATVVSTINAGTTGVTATYDVKTARLSLASAQPFTITDASSGGATNTANFVEAFGLPTQANLQTDVSAQLTDVDTVLNQALSARGVIGATIQNLSTLQSSSALTSTNEVASKSALIDVNVPEVTTKFTLSQTALQAAYLVTSRIEGHMLFDYL